MQLRPFVLIFLLPALQHAGAQAFVDRTAALGLALDGGAAAWGDINGDGWPDLLCGSAVWVNREGTSFTRLPTPLAGSGLIADIDNDGNGDLVYFSPTIAVYRTRGEGAAGERFEAVALPKLPETVSRGAAVGDYNGDGYLDVYVGGFEGWEKQITYPDLLLMNEGGKGFRLAQVYAGWRARGVTACDFDEDGDLDVYVSNYRLQPNVLWMNDGHGAFVNEAPKRNAMATSPGFPGGHSIGACWGDFDNDGRIDLFAGNFAHVDSRGDQPKSRFLKNLGAGGAWAFEDKHECGVWYQESYASPACADFDNDGLLDLYLTTVYADASFGKKNYPVLYRNQGGWEFKDVTEGSGLERLAATYQSAWADFDRSGRVSLVTAGRLYVNTAAAPGNHWLELRLVGGAGMNRDAVGAQARVKGPDGRVFTRQVEVGTGEGAANSPILHFGVGAAAGPFTVEIRWPGGIVQSVPGIPADQLTTLRRDSSGALQSPGR